MSTRSPAPRSVVDRTGAVVAGRYRVTELLGVGGMGSVWAAEHLALRREVVIKFLEPRRPGLHEVALVRFRREAKLLAAIRHRNVLEHYETAMMPTGEPVLITERLRGETVATRADRFPVPTVQEALAIAAAIADGLEVVHAAGVVHRDVKSENIILHEEDDGATTPKLIDFGLARRQQAGDRVTMLGSTVGTPGFMAPEQARGREDLDGRADVHALGVTLYDLCAGYLPWEGRTGSELILNSVSEAPRALSAYRPDLRGRIEAVVMRAITRDPDDRYASARDFAAALRGVVQTIPPETSVAPPKSRLSAAAPRPPPIPRDARRLPSTDPDDRT